MSGALAALLAAACLTALCLVPRRRPYSRSGGLSVEPPRGARRTPPAPSSVVGHAHAGSAGSAGSVASSALVADAAAALLRAGASVPLALTRLGSEPGPAPELAVVARMLAWGAEPERAWAAAPQHKGLREALALAESTGAPVSVVLSRRAQEQRRGRARDEEARAAALAVKLVLPMGLCGLPAFICLGIVPIGLALVPW